MDGRIIVIPFNLLAVVEDLLNLLLVEVGQSDGFDQTIVDQLFHLSPRLDDADIRRREAPSLLKSGCSLYESGGTKTPRCCWRMTVVLLPQNDTGRNGRSDSLFEMLSFFIA